jgi:hypothetical protein
MFLGKFFVTENSVTKKIVSENLKNTILFGSFY